VLLPVSWPAIAPHRPAQGTNPSDPANPAYNWGSLDDTVRAVTARGLTVAFTVAGVGGPAWADGPGRPRSAPPGTWRPNARAFGEFATAVARRYSGHFNPGTGTLPHVRYYQGWSEPNLYNHLTPQWVRRHGHWIPESAIIYRGLLNAFYAGIKAVNRANVVITGGTAPFGDLPPGSRRVPPALFWRTLLCLKNRRLALAPCPHPAHFDALAHHPYEIGGPFQPAGNPDDVSLPDMWKIRQALEVAQRTGRALPRGHKRLWITEFSWDSKPPDPHGVPMKRWTRWLQEAFFEAWRQGVSAFVWYLIADQPPIPDYASTYQSGLYYANGHPKPGVRAFRFPFVVERAAQGRRRVWGVSPVAGKVQVQVRRSGHWRPLAGFAEPAHGVFTKTMSLGRGWLLRAQVGSQTSLAWRVS
jgi:hypothetical protein